MNTAGAWRLPVVFVVADDQWRFRCRHANKPPPPPLREKPCAAGIPGEQCDGDEHPGGARLHSQRH